MMAAFAVCVSSRNCNSGNVFSNVAELSQTDVEVLARIEDDSMAAGEGQIKCYTVFGVCGNQTYNWKVMDVDPKTNKVVWLDRSGSSPVLGTVCVAASGYGFYCEPGDCGYCTTNAHDYFNW